MSDKPWRRDAGAKRRDADAIDSPPHDRVFRMTEAEREAIAGCLQYIDEARDALEQQQHRENREIIRELRASADRIFDILNALDETDPGV